MFYYGIALIVLLLLNMFLVPNLSKTKVEEVGYGKFLEMLGSGEIKEAEVNYDDRVVTFGDKSEPENYYKSTRPPSSRKCPQFSQHFWDG